MFTIIARDPDASLFSRLFWSESEEETRSIHTDILLPLLIDVSTFYHGIYTNVTNTGWLSDGQRGMNAHLDFRALLLKIQDVLSDTDRHRLHFLLGEDVPRCLRDDVSLSGTLRLLDALFERTFISDRDCDYLIDAFTKIQCLDAAQRLRGSFILFLSLSLLNDYLISFRVSANTGGKQASKHLIARYSLSR